MSKGKVVEPYIKAFPKRNGQTRYEAWCQIPYRIRKITGKNRLYRGCATLEEARASLPGLREEVRQLVESIENRPSGASEEECCVLACTHDWGMKREDNNGRTSIAVAQATGDPCAVR